MRVHQFADIFMAGNNRPWRIGCSQPAPIGDIGGADRNADRAQQDLARRKGLEWAAAQAAGRRAGPSGSNQSVLLRTANLSSPALSTESRTTFQPMVNPFTSGRR